MRAEHEVWVLNYRLRDDCDCMMTLYQALEVVLRLATKQRICGCKLDIISSAIPTEIIRSNNSWENLDLSHAKKPEYKFTCSCRLCLHLNEYDLTANG